MPIILRSSAMTRETWFAVSAVLGTSFVLSGCGASQTISLAPITQKTEETAGERLIRVRRLMAGGPDVAGAAEALVEALDSDEDLSVRKVAAVGLLSFGDKS